MSFLMVLDAGPGLYLTTSILLLLSLSWCKTYWDNRSHPPLPPGPPTLPILGSILSLSNPARPWLDFNSWRSTYGDIVYARLLGKPVVVVSSEEVARDLFESRSAIYTDRPQSVLFKPFALDFNTGFMPYGERWRLHRRIFHQSFREIAIPAYHSELLCKTHSMLLGFLQDPNNYTHHFHMFAASIMASIVYAYEPETKDDHVIRAMRSYVKFISDALGAGSAMITEAFPFLLQLPAWFPGATSKRASVKCLQAAHDLQEIPFQYTRKRMSDEETPSCLVADAMNKLDGFESDVTETAIKEAASIVFAGSDTMVDTLLVFLLVMALHPDVQVKAQTDIDRVVGKDRLPNFNDRSALPYTDAILRETFRWYPVAPMTVPHATMTDDIYNGYFIPKGMSVIANTWAMTHDEKKYPCPDEFKPERFLCEDGSLTGDTMPLGFGWGRRMCAGRHLVEPTLWIAITSFLATFSVRNALDEHGKEIPIVPKFTTGFSIHPETFPCRIVPRFHDTSVERMTQLAGSKLPVK